MKRPILVLVAVVIVSWMLLLLSFFGMALLFKLTAGLHGITIQIIRDLLGFLLFAIWAILFFLMRQLAAKALNVY